MKSFPSLWVKKDLANYSHAPEPSLTWGHEGHTVSQCTEGRLYHCGHSQTFFKS